MESNGKIGNIRFTISYTEMERYLRNRKVYKMDGLGGAAMEYLPRLKGNGLKRHHVKLNKAGFS